MIEPEKNVGTGLQLDRERHVDHACVEHSQFGNEPVGPAFRNHADSVAALQAESHKAGGKAEHLGAHFRVGQGNIFSVFFFVDKRIVRKFRNSIFEQANNCFNHLYFRIIWKSKSAPANTGTDSNCRDYSDGISRHKMRYIRTPENAVKIVSST